MLDSILPRRRLLRNVEKALSGMDALPRDFIGDPDCSYDLDILRSISGSAHASSVFPAETALARLIVEAGERDEDVDIQHVSAVTASRGPYIGNLPRLRETITPPENPITDEAELVRLFRKAAEVEGFSRNKAGRFRVQKEGWSKRLIAVNTGAARRISWLQEFGRRHDIVFPCTIECYDLSREAIKVLTEDYWIVIVPLDAWLELQDLSRHFRKSQMVLRMSSLAPPKSENPAMWVATAFPKPMSWMKEVLTEAPTSTFDFSAWLSRISHPDYRYTP